MAERKQRYRLDWTPVGWQLVDTESTDSYAEVAMFGLGSDEYQRAKAERDRLNEEADRG